MSGDIAGHLINKYLNLISLLKRLVCSKLGSTFGFMLIADFAASKPQNFEFRNNSENIHTSAKFQKENIMQFARALKKKLAKCSWAQIKIMQYAWIHKKNMVRSSYQINLPLKTT